MDNVYYGLVETEALPIIQSRTPVVAVYCDGGCAGANPSHIGGTWAFRHVNAQGEVVHEESGVIHGFSTNNVMELEAAVRCLEALPAGWTGTLYSDSQNTIGRLFYSWALNKVPKQLIDRMGVQLRRMGTITPVLLQGHPTKADLAAGIGKKRGLPVSIHNVACDALCDQRAAELLNRAGVR